MRIIYDFSFALVVLTALTGLITAVDTWVLRSRRLDSQKLPWLVEYSRSFFPVILIVLLVRSFLFEPFRIPSDSMMPTLLDGDFIFVNKFIYGIKLPVLNNTIIAVSDPQRGDIIVFRKPSEPSVNYIKRLVGLPGDRLDIRGDAVWVNGVEAIVKDAGPFAEDKCYVNFHQGIESLGEHQHRVMYCPTEPSRHSRGCTSTRDLSECPVNPQVPAVPSNDATFAPTGTFIVPPGFYFFMGDNRDNSQDSRFSELGFVPEENVVGKAVRIWMSFEGFPIVRWARIGQAIN
jgi:signal peptidase I